MLFLVVFLAIDLCVCDNFTERYLKSDDLRRESRFFTFNTDNDKIYIELEFKVPFVSIPVKRTVEESGKAFANVNLGAIAVGGAIAIVTGLIVPAVSTLFGEGGLLSKPGGLAGLFHKPQHDSYGYPTRDEDEERSTLWKFMDTLDKALSENDIDTTSCMQRAICWTTQSSNRNMAKGRASSGDKIIDGIATNEWVKNIIDGTVFEAAIESGLRGDNCSKIYNQCSINQNTLHHFAMQYMSPRSRP